MNFCSLKNSLAILNKTFSVSFKHRVMLLTLHLNKVLRFTKQFIVCQNTTVVFLYLVHSVWKLLKMSHLNRFVSLIFPTFEFWRYSLPIQIPNYFRVMRLFEWFSNTVCSSVPIDLIHDLHSFLFREVLLSYYVPCCSKLVTFKTPWNVASNVPQERRWTWK